jgi:diketogulonate reductase-like aldo/keto reductase
MNDKELGASGVRISEIGLGSWGYAGPPELLRSGVEQGGANFIDTAESYGTEEVVGRAVAGIRDRVLLATKISPEHFRRDALIQAAEASLRRLQTDYIDLLQLHQPNPSVPIAETMGALGELVDAGKVRFLGVSNFSIQQLEAARQASRHPIVSNQVRYNLVDRTIEGGLLDYCVRQRITVIAYSPLARLFNRILDGDPRGALSALARKLGKTPAQIALNWCICRDSVVAIPKTHSLERQLENCAASGWYLTPEDRRRLDVEIQYRRRGLADRLVRKCVPRSLSSTIRYAVQCLPPSIRRRLN